MYKEPEISVIMATYNDPITYVKLSVDSIRRQTFTDWEFIIADDSTDASVKNLLDEYAKNDQRIKILRFKRKLGFVASLNAALTQATGEYVARMDADDISFSERLEREKFFLDNNPDVTVVGASVEIIDANGKVTGKRNYGTDFSEIKKHAFFRNPLAHPTVMFRRKSVMKLNCYDEEFSMAEDYELWLRLIKTGHELANLPERLLSYRMGDEYYKRRPRKNWEYNFAAKKKNLRRRFCRDKEVCFFS